MVLNELWRVPFDKRTPLEFNRMGHSILAVSRA